MGTRKCIAVIALLAAAGLVGCVSRPAREPDVAAEGTYPFDLPPAVVDDEHQSITCDLPVTNTTDRTMRVTDVQTSCGCTKAELSTTELAPGGQAVLRIQLNLHGRDGPFQATARLLTDDTATPVREYVVRTTVMPRVLFAPRSLFLGLAEPESELSSEAAVLLPVPDGVAFPRLESVMSDSPSLSVEAGEGVDEPTAGGRRLRVPLRLTARTAQQTGGAGAVVTATCVWDGGRCAERLGVSWNVQGVLSLNPATVYFGTVSEAVGPITRRVMVRRNDNQPVALTDIRPGHPAVSCRPEATPDGVWVLELTLDPARLDGPVVGQVEAATDHPRQPRLRIEYSALK